MSSPDILSFDSVLEKDKSDIQKWYKTDEAQSKLNPEFLLDIDESLRGVFKYIIRGWEQMSDIEFISLFQRLVKSFRGLPNDVKTSELLLFELIFIANKLKPLTLTTPFLSESYADDQAFLEDFSDHFPVVQLRGLQFDMYVGVNDSVFNHLFFLTSLKRFITPVWLEKLNDLRDAHELNIHNTIAKYNYRLEISKAWIQITLSIIDVLNEKNIAAENTADVTIGLGALLHGLPFLGNSIVKDTTQPKTGGVFDYIQKDMPLNRSGQNLPKMMFKDIKDTVVNYFQNVDSLKETNLHSSKGLDDWGRNDMKLSYIKYFVKTFEAMYNRIHIVDIKTPEQFYDLFDSIHDKKTTSDRLNKNGTSTDNYPLRTFHFRKDSLLNSDKGATIDDSFTGNPYTLEKPFWEAIDRYCYNTGKSLNIFAGILGETTHIGAFYEAMKWELIDNSDKEYEHETIISNELKKLKRTIDNAMYDKCVQLNIEVPIQETSNFPKYYYRIDGEEDARILLQIVANSGLKQRNQIKIDRAIAEAQQRKAVDDIRIEAEKAAKKARDDADEAARKAAKDSAAAAAKAKAIADKAAEKTRKDLEADAAEKARKARINAERIQKFVSRKTKLQTAMDTMRTYLDTDRARVVAEYDGLSATDKVTFDTMDSALAAKVQAMKLAHNAEMARIRSP